MAIPLQYDIFARDRASGPLDKVGRSMDQNSRSAGRMSKSFAAAGRVMKVGLAAGAVAAAVGLKKMYSEADEARKVGNLTAAAIKSTGGAANVTAAQVEKLANAVSQKTGIDDETIQSGENLLLTFKNIHNEVGRGNKIFDRATKSAVDLSAAGFGDLTATSKQLGKALNDPVKGMTALGRAGVTFTQQQKDQVAKLVETGRTLKAQKLILREVESQVGGAAASQATPLAKLKVTIDNIFEVLGGKLLPIVDRAATWLGDRLPAALDMAGHGAGALSGKLSGLVGWFKGDFVTSVRAMATDLLPHLKAAWDSISGTIRDNKSTFKSLGRLITEVIVPVLGKAAGILVDVLGPAFKGLVWIIKFVVLPVFAAFVAGVLTAFDGIIGAAANMARWLHLPFADSLTKMSGEVHAFVADTNATLASILTDTYTTVHITPVVDPLHNAGFIGPTMAEGKAAAGIAGPYTDADRGVVTDAARATGEKRAAAAVAAAARRAGASIGDSLATGLAGTASKVGDAGQKVADAAAAKFDKIKQAAESLRDSVHDSVMGFFSLKTEGNPFAGLSAMANKAVRFAHALAKLARQGVNPNVIAMIAQAGPDVGLRAAVMLSTAGKANRNRIDKAYTTISNAADRAGNVVMNAQYGDQLGVAKKSERHLKKIADAVTKGGKGSALANGWAAY